MLTRYDGWFAGAIFSSVVLMLLARAKFCGAAQIELKKLRVATIKFVLVVASVPIFWLAYNAFIYGNALEFATGPYSARAIEQRSTQAGQPPHPGHHNLWLATIYFIKSAEANLANGNGQKAWLLLAIAGTAIMLFRYRGLGAWLLLWIPLPFYSLSVAYGGVPIFMPVWWPFSYYNVRYGLQLLPAIVVFTSAALYFCMTHLADRRARLVVVLIAFGFAGSSYIFIWRAQPICLREAVANSRTRVPFERALAEQLQRIQNFQLPDGWDKDLPSFPADAKGMATRESSGKVLNALAKNIPWLLGGSADLAHSNKTNLTFEGAGDFYANEYRGRNLHFGVREHGMGSAVNGLSVSRLRAYSATFFNFSDYMRPAMRLAALMETPSIFIFTHDSIGLGEDGPTHQPVEQLAAFRAMPNMIVLRPGDANEVLEAYKVILQLRHSPATLVLTRQALPTFDRSKFGPASGVAKGAYILADAANGKPDVILMASGSEVQLCMAAYEKLKAENINARVVSMPSWELFEKQDAAYRESVFPSNVTARVSVEMAATTGWERYVGPKGKAIGMHSFGASAPLKDLLKKFGFLPENVVAAVKEVLGK